MLSYKAKRVPLDTKSIRIRVKALQRPIVKTRDKQRILIRHWKGIEERVQKSYVRIFANSE